MEQAPEQVPVPVPEQVLELEQAPEPHTRLEPYIFDLSR
jgi:hypothetical protein